MNTKTQFAPAVMFPLPMHHGVTVLLMTLTGILAISLVLHFMRSPKRDMF